MPNSALQEEALRTYAGEFVAYALSINLISPTLTQPSLQAGDEDGDIEKVQNLIAKEVDVNAVDEEDFPPFLHMFKTHPDLHSRRTQDGQPCTLRCIPRARWRLGNASLPRRPKSTRKATRTAKPRCTWLQIEETRIQNTVSGLEPRLWSLIMTRTMPRPFDVNPSRGAPLFAKMLIEARADLNGVRL